MGLCLASHTYPWHIPFSPCITDRGLYILLKRHKHFCIEEIQLVRQFDFDLEFQLKEFTAAMNLKVRDFAAPREDRTLSQGLCSKEEKRPAEGKFYDHGLICQIITVLYHLI